MDDMSDDKGEKPRLYNYFVTISTDITVQAESQEAAAKLAQKHLRARLHRDCRGTIFDVKVSAPRAPGWEPQPILCTPAFYGITYHDLWSRGGTPK